MSYLCLVIVKPIDRAGVGIYATELLLWIGIMICGVVYNLRVWLYGKGTHGLSSPGMSNIPSTYSALF